MTAASRPGSASARPSPWASPSPLGIVAWTWRTGAVGGSDSACYALMARVFAEGAWQPMSPLALDAPWPDPTRVAAPAGFLPSVARAGAAVPVCAPGYSLLLAPLVAGFGPAVVHLVPPVAAACLVWLAYLLGRRLASPEAGVAAAVLVASTPDRAVPGRAADERHHDRRAVAGRRRGDDGRTSRRSPGALVGVALLVRPNLAVAAAAAASSAPPGCRAARPRPGAPVRACPRRRRTGGRAPHRGGHAAELAALRLATPVGLRRSRRTVRGRPRARERGALRPHVDRDRHAVGAPGHGGLVDRCHGVASRPPPSRRWGWRSPPSIWSTGRSTNGGSCASCCRRWRSPPC